MGHKAKKKVYTAYANVASTALVVCDNDHKLAGLFVIFKLADPPADSKAAKIARVVEGSPSPGDPPVEPTAPKELTEADKKDKKAKARYDAAKKEYDKAKKKHDKAREDYDESKKKFDDLPPDPASQFVCGFVDDDGFLTPVHDGANPWYDTATRRDPDTYKLTPGEKYKVCLVRHPSPGVARAVTRLLNKASTKDDAVYDLYAWGDWDKIVREVTIEKVTTPKGDQGVMRLPEGGDAYVPKGSDRYGKWTLYRDMPHTQCAGVADQVKILQKDLALLHFPIGETETPYKPRENDHTIDMTLGAKPKKANEPPFVTVYAFDGQVQGAVARLHEIARAGEAFVLAQKDKALGGRHLYYVLGSPYDPKAHADLKWPSLRQTTTLGVVDDDTADLIAHWIDKGIVKPHDHLVPFSDDIWMLVRGAAALTAWSAVAEAFAVQYGIAPGSSFRSILVGAWAGAINNSIHKTGLAVDLSGGGNRMPSSKFPVRYEASWKKPRNDEGATEEDNQTKVNWTQRWRLYGHSDLDVFGDQAGAIKKLKESLAKLGGVPWPPADGATVSYKAEESGLYKVFLKKWFNNDTDASVGVWLTKTVKPVLDYIVSLLGATPEAIVDQYFRKAVVQWSPNAYEGDGGSAGKVYKPTDGDGDYPARAWAKSWVNLTAVAYYCQMERIGPHKWDIRDQSWVLGPDNPKAAPQPWSMHDYFIVKDDEDKDLVVMLYDITRGEADAPELRERETSVPIRRDDAVIAKYKPKEIDGDFVKDWRDKARGFDAEFRPGKKKDGPTDPKGAQIALILSAAEGKRAAIDKVLDALKGPFAKKSFALMHAGDLAMADIGDAGKQASAGAPVMSGADVAAKLKKGADDFTAQATVNAKAAEDKKAEDKKADEDAAAKAKADDKKPPPKPKKTKQQLRDEQKAAEAFAAKTREAWTVVLQPVFLKTPDPKLLPFLPDDDVVLPPGSNANHLEWWHYQHRSAGTWGPLLEECGYSKKVMGTPLSGTPHANAEPVHRGLGYSQKELDGNPGGGDEAGIENRDGFTPPGF